MTERIACVGAGRMGRGMAIAFAYAGMRVNLIDRKARSDDAWVRFAAEAQAEVQGSLQLLVRLGAAPADALQRIASRVQLVRETEADAALAAATVVFVSVRNTARQARGAGPRVHCGAGRRDHRFNHLDHPGHRLGAAGRTPSD